MKEIHTYDRRFAIISIASAELAHLKAILDIDRDFKNKSQLKEMQTILEEMAVEAIRNNIIEEELAHIASTVRYLRIIAEGYAMEAKPNDD